MRLALILFKPYPVGNLPCGLSKIQHLFIINAHLPHSYVPFGVTYEKIGTIQRRLAWPLHKDDTLSRSGRSTDLNIYFILHICASAYCHQWYSDTVHHKNLL